MATGMQSEVVGLGGERVAEERFRRLHRNDMLARR